MEHDGSSASESLQLIEVGSAPIWAGAHDVELPPVLMKVVHAGECRHQDVQPLVRNTGDRGFHTPDHQDPL
ncbi:hypothetical protein SDC9_89874 [bioreactor metagenome]|uniref:Uncharacterized protein n=1 Tax=bioreactor metagenome TaxID=1076179 RepID=A0A644ZTI2_9ZZZZ